MQRESQRASSLEKLPHLSLSRDLSNPCPHPATVYPEGLILDQMHEKSFPGKPGRE
jgi:hypothetical protein